MMAKQAIGALLYLAFATPVLAQETDSEEIRTAAWRVGDALDYCFEFDHLDELKRAEDDCKEITVFGAPLARPSSDQSTSIYDLNLLRTPSSDRLENTLRLVPGLQQFRRSDSRSANPTSQGITMRGLGGNASSRSILTLDGVPQADPFGGWIAWPGYDAVKIGFVRARRGSGLVTEGNGALAGSIELNSDGDFTGGELRTDYGSRNSIEGKANLGRELGSGHVFASASYMRGDGFVPIIARQRGVVDREAGYEQAGLALRGVAPIAVHTELQASMRAFTDSRDRGVDFSDSENSGVDVSLRVVRRGTGWQWSALGYIQIRDFASRFGAVAADRNSVGLTLDQYSVPSTGLGARFEVRPPIGDNAELRVGGDWRRTIGETKENSTFTGTVPSRNRIAGGQTDTMGIFTELSFKPLDDLMLTAGGRADYWRIADGFRKEVNIGGTVRSDDVFTDRLGWEGTGRVGFAYEGVADLKLRGAAYWGWRLPTLNELYRPFRAGADATAANELLAPERVKGVELGFDFDNGPFSFSSTAFLNRLSNAIANVSEGVGPGNFPGVGFVAAGGVYRRRENLDAIDSKGLEIDASFDFDPFRLRGSYAYVDARVTSDGLAAFLNGLRPAQVPSHFANAAIEYDGTDVDADITLRYVGVQYEDDLNSQRLSDAFTLDAGFSYRLNSNLAVSLRGENILDAEVQAALSSSGIVERASPRTIWFGIRFTTG